MKKSLLFELAKFAFSRKTFLERMRYLVLGAFFYHFLSRSFSVENQGDGSADCSQAGDDVYPLF